jgi:hypothetical protein
VVRLYLAAALQRLSFDERWPILSALSKHEEDIDDNNLPRMLWLALEPMVPEKPERALALAAEGKIPLLQTHTARRLVSGALTTAPPKKGANVPEWQGHLQRVAPGFRIHNVGEGGVVPLSSFRNEAALQTHPLNRKTPCIISQHLDIPEGESTHLKLRASYHPHGDWQLRVLVGKEVLIDQIVSYATVKDEWLTLDVDLSRFAGKHVELVIENRANDWMNEFGYWGSIEVVSGDGPEKKPGAKPRKAPAKNSPSKQQDPASSNPLKK